MINLNRVTRSRAFSQLLSAQSGDRIIGFTGIIQPAGQEDLQLLPEGERYFPAVAVDASTQLKYGDLVRHQSEQWRIVSVGDWSHYGYYHYVAVRYEGTERSDSGGFGIKEELS